MNDFATLRRAIERDLFAHPVVQDNPFTSWFAEGDLDREDVRDMIREFSVFSNHFLVVQVKRMVNAGSEEGEVCARNILMNECGVSIDPHSGSPEGRTFATARAHINWLRELGERLGMDRRELGRWESGSKATHEFLDGLDATYGSRDPMIGAGASFAIETWAAFGIGEPGLEARNFWKQLITGLEAHDKDLPIGFFKYHFELEAGHGANVWKELRDTFGKPGFDSHRFLRGGRKALDAIHTFWLGLDEARRERHATSPSRLNVAQLGF